jgi:hypothetical protein
LRITTSGLGGFDLTAFFFVLVVLVGLVDLALDLEALAIPPAFPLSHFSSDLLKILLYLLSLKIKI